MDKLRVGDLFCGMGGASKGAARAGAEVVFGIEKCPIAAAAYKYSHKEAVVFEDDITFIDPTVLPPVDVLLASPPCTMHSIGRINKCIDESVNDLAMEVIRYAKQINPAYIVVENVIRMKNWKRIDEFMNELLLLGYWIDVKILDAVDFGAGAVRKRMFIMCSKEPILFDWNIKPNKNTKQLRIRDILDLKNHPPSTPLAGELARRALQCAEEKLGPSKPFVFAYYSGWGERSFVRGMDEPLDTITTVDRFRFVNEDRRTKMLQPNELAKAMKIEEPYAKSKRDKVRLIGNAVSPPVMEAIIRAIPR